MAIYSASHILLSLHEFYSSVVAYALDQPSSLFTANCVSRASLQLLTSFSLLPVLFVSAARWNRNSRRVAVLVAFLIALSLIIDAILRLLPCLHAFLYGRHVSTYTPSSTLLLLHLIVHGTWLSLTPTTILFVSRLFKLPSFLYRLTVPADVSADSIYKILRTHAITILLVRISSTYSHNSYLTARLSATILIAIIVCCVVLVWPSLTESINILLHTTPSAQVQSIRSRRDRVLALDGVVHCSHLHFWEENPQFVIGTLHVAVQPSACKYTVLRQATAAFDGLVDDLTVQVEDWRPT